MGDDGARQLSALFRHRLVRWDARAGVYRVEMDEDPRRILRELMEQFMQLISDPDAPALQRLFPPAYSDPGHAEFQDEYRRLMQDDLVERNREAAELVVSTSSARTLTEEQMLAWSRAINSVRLVLGTYLDVSEDDSFRAPRTTEESAYRWLSYLLEETIEALSRQT